MPAHDCSKDVENNQVVWHLNIRLELSINLERRVRSPRAFHGARSVKQFFYLIPGDSKIIETRKWKIVRFIFINSSSFGSKYFAAVFWIVRWRKWVYITFESCSAVRRTSEGRIWLLLFKVNCFEKALIRSRLDAARDFIISLYRTLQLLVLLFLLTSTSTSFTYYSP